MEYILFSNQALKYKSGEFTDLIDSGERKIVFKIENESLCSLLVYNMYDSPHSVIRGIKQANVIRRESDFIEVQGFGLSSNGFPIDHLHAKILFENDIIISVEYIDYDRDVSLLHKKRIEKNSNFFFELFNLEVYDFDRLSSILRFFSSDFQKIKNHNDEIEISVCSSLLFNLTINQSVRKEKPLHFLLCLVNFYFQYKSILLRNDYHERQKMIDLLNRNGETFIMLITVVLLRNTRSKIDVPFSNDSEDDRAIKIFWLLESYYLFIEQTYDGSAKWEDVVNYNKSNFNCGVFYPYNIANSKDITQKLFDLLYDNIMNFIENNN